LIQASRPLWGDVLGGTVTAKEKFKSRRVGIKPNRKTSRKNANRKVGKTV